MQRDAAGELVREVHRRAELESLLEAEASAAGYVWLGQFVRGEWEINPKAVGAALGFVLGCLVRQDLVSAIPAEACGKHHPAWLISNTYVKGEPWPKPAREAKLKREAEEEEEPEELADIELERQANIERNKEVLRSLGLL